MGEARSSRPGRIETKVQHQIARKGVMVLLSFLPKYPQSGRATKLQIDSRIVSSKQRTLVTAERIEGARSGLKGGLDDEECSHADKDLSRS